MGHFEDDEEPTDEQLEQTERDDPESDLVVDGAFGFYSLHTDRIKLLASIVKSFADVPQLDQVREIVEHELKLTLAQTEPYRAACIAADRSATEGRTSADF